MNFYQHHIGDFNSATRHLTRLERSIYRDLLDIYYDTERPLTSDCDRLARRCIIDDDDCTAMRDVLNEFFILLDDGYHNTRADKEIAAYKRMAEGGKRGAEKRWGKGSDTPPIATPSPPHTKANANHEPITMNQEPKEKTPAAPAFVLPEWIPVDTWAAYLQTRKAKRAKNEPHALGLIVKDLAGIRDKGHDPTVVLNNSIKSGWAGVFAPKTLGTFAQVKADAGRRVI